MTYVLVTLPTQRVARLHVPFHDHLLLRSDVAVLGLLRWDRLKAVLNTFADGSVNLLIGV